MTPGETAARAADEMQRMLSALPVEATGVVVGAPGSGKTATIVERVRALVAAGMSPDDLLVLTPTRQTATALRDRLALAVGGATSGPLARSVAAFAFQLVRAATVHAGLEPPQLLTGGDEDQIVQDLLDGDAEDEARGRRRWPAELGPQIRATTGFRAEVRAFLAECTTLGIEPRRLTLLAERHDVPVWASLAAFADDYLSVRAGMRGAHRDAAGLVREAVGILRTSGTDASLGDVARIRAILVDDAQELTLGGVELLEACRRRGIAVLAFGDPDVGSGAFRGATPENFARLSAALGGLAGVLTVQHRSTAAQTDLVRTVTERIGAAGMVAHRAAPSGAPADASVRALHLRSASEEYDVVARLLRERHVRDGVPWSACAVIAHDTRQVAALEAELGAREVPARASGPGRALGALAPVRDLLRLIELAAADVAAWTADDAHAVLLGCCGGLDPVGIRRLRTTLRHAELADGGERSGRDLLLSAMAHPIEFELVDTREGRRGARLARTLATLRRQLAEGATVHELLWTAWEQSGLEREWGQSARGHGPLAEQADRDLDAVVALFESAKRFVERQGEDGRPSGRDDGVALTFVRGILSADVAEDRLGRPAVAESVLVLTPAAALGTEFDTVVIAGVQDGVWPNTRLRGGLLETWRLADAAAGGDAVTAADALDRRRGALHDELRLFARALSRARSRVVVTAVDDDDTGPSVLFELLPTPEGAERRMEHPLSLRGLVAAHRRTLTEGVAPPVGRARAAGQLALLAEAGVAGADPAEWYGVPPPTSTAPLRDTGREDVRVSPSRLHALEVCQLDWVIGDLGGDAGGAVAGLGTILHAALEHAEGADEASLWRIVEGRWSELEFESPWRDRAERTRARDLVRRLAVYLDTFAAEGGTLLGAEPHFEVRLDEQGIVPASDDAAGERTPGIVLGGYIDRVELTAGGAVVIVDLKTGKSEPQTDKAVADNPQLAAYQLAFEAGAIPAAAGYTAGGAKLLVLRPTAARRDYAEPRQAPFDEETREAFVGRVRTAATAMSGASFLAPYEEHCRDDHSYGLCRIHTIKAVSAS